MSDAAIGPELREESIDVGKPGREIKCVYNYCDKSRPLIVLVPFFEGTARNNMLPAIYLQRNGFNTLRFDFRNHPGASPGKFKDFTLSGGYQDLKWAMECARTLTQRDGGGLGVLGISLGTRLVNRYLVENHERADVFVSLLGVVHAARTILEATGQDVRLLLENPKHDYGGMHRAVNRKIDVDRFMGDFVEKDWYSLNKLRQEVARTAVPTYLVVAESDKWVDIKEYDEAYADNRGILRGTYYLPGAGHKIYDNPEVAKTAALAVTKCFREFFGIVGPMAEEPTIAEIMELNTREREREREAVWDYFERAAAQEELQA